MPESDVELTVAQLAELTREVTSDSGPGDHTKRFNAAVIDTFREHGGKVPGELEQIAMLLVTARGAKTGVPRTVPLGYFYVDDRLVVIASMGGADINPPWYANVVANPDVTVELGDETFPAVAVVTTGEDRERLFAGVVAQSGVFGEYQTRTTRLLPVVELKRAPDPSPAD
jgi:deazaflavin-dependent oxidoreductase (nitroreductase family)